MAGTSDDPLVLSDDDERVISVPASDISGQLVIKESRIVPGQPGLFTKNDLPPNSFVCVYVYDLVLTGAQMRALSNPRSDAVSKYAVAGPRGLTLVIDTPTTAKHVAAFANEPGHGNMANMQLHADIVTTSNGLSYFGVALYTCNTPVIAGSELTWNYGPSYQPVRVREHYSAGGSCVSIYPLSPPIDYIFEHIVTTRGVDGVDGILLRMDTESSSDGSDSDYRGQSAPQKRRVMPPRTSAWIDDMIQKRMSQLAMRSRNHAPFRSSPLATEWKHCRDVED